MPRYLAKNCLNELLQSFQSSISGLLISEEIPRLELAAHDDAQQSLVSNFVSSHPWLQDKIDFNGLNLTEMKIREEVQRRLPMNTSCYTPSFFEREAEWCLPKSQFDESSPCCSLAELCNCCISVAQPNANNWMGFKNTADDNEISQFILEEVLMDSYGSRGRLPLVSELSRRLKSAVVPDPLFGQSSVSETLLFRDEIAPLDLLLRKWDQTLYECSELSSIEDERRCYVRGIETQNLVLEEPISLHGWTFDGARLLLLELEPRSLLEEFNSAEEAVDKEAEEAEADGQELIICGVLARLGGRGDGGGGLQLETENLNYRLVGPIELLSKSPPSDNCQRLSFINETLGDAVKREAFLWLESPLLKSHTRHQCNCGALCADCLAVEEVGEEEETTDQLLTEPFACCLLSKLPEEELLAKLWQNEKYFDEIQLLAVREFQLESTTSDVLLSVRNGLTSVWSASDALCLTSEEITSSQELNLAWDPLKASYGLMTATEKLCMEPAMQSSSSSCPSRRLYCSSAADEKSDEEPSIGNGAQHPSPLLLLRPQLQCSRTVETYKKGNIQSAEADRCVSYDHHHHLADPTGRNRPTAAAAAAAATLSSISSNSHRSQDVALQLFDPLDQFLMLRKAPPSLPPPPPPSSKGRSTVSAAAVDGQANHGGGGGRGGGGGSGSSLVAVVQPCVNSAAAAAIESSSSSNPLPLRWTVSDAYSGSVFPAPGSWCEEEEEEAETKNRSSTNLPASTIINISLTAPPFENLLRLIEDAARPFVALLRRHRILASDQTFNSLQSDVMGFIVKQQQNDFSAVMDDDSVELKMDLLRAAICVHCLVRAHDHLMHSCLSSAAHVLSVMKAGNQQILVGSVLDNVLQKVLLEEVRHRTDEILHPKALEMCHIIRQFHSTFSRTDFKSKILVILPSSESHDVTLCLGQYLLETLTSVEGTRPVLLSSSLLPADLHKRSDACNCYLVESNDLTTDDWGPSTDFALVIEYSFSLASASFKEKCRLLKLPFVGLRSNTEILELPNDDDNDESDDDVISRSCLQQISIVMSRDLTSKHTELIRLLETRYNVVVTDRDYTSLVVSGYFEDITVGGSTVIVIEDLMVLRRKQEMERLVMKVNGLKQKSVSCWILVFSSNNKRHHGQRPRPSTDADSSDIYSTNVIINISKLQASFGVLAKPDFQIKVVFCHSYNSMAMRIRQIVSDALSRMDSSSSNSIGLMKVASSCPTIEPAEDERFLLSFPSLNSISAQMLLRTGGSLMTLLTMFKPDLLEMLSSSSLPNKIIQEFFEFRESVGEIFLILRQAQCRAGQNLLLSISQMNEKNNSSENICHLTPHNATFAGCRMMAADRTEGMDKEEEEDLSKDVHLNLTNRVSSPKLNDFQEAEIFGKNFATFLSRLKSDLSDKVRLGTEEVERERRRRLAVQFDCSDDDDDDDVHPVDLNAVHSQSVEIDEQLDYYSFTDSRKSSSSARIPLMLRNESKRIDDGFALNAVVSAAAAAAARGADNNNIFKTDTEEEDCSGVPKTNCYSAINSNGSTYNGRHFKTVTDKSTINSNSTDKFPLGTYSTLPGEGDIIYDCRNILHVENRFFSNDQEIEKYQRAQNMQTTGFNDGARVETCYRTQVDFGNMLPDVEIVRTCGTDSDLEMDSVDRRRFRQPVQSLTLDGNNFPEEKLKRNFWSHTKGRHPFGYWWLSQESSSPAHGVASLRKRKLTFERDDATKSGQTKLKFI